MGDGQVIHTALRYQYCHGKLAPVEGSIYQCIQVQVQVLIGLTLSIHPPTKLLYSMSLTLSPATLRS